MKMDSLVGQTINFWTILEARPNKLKSTVLAQCICGVQKVVSGRSIKNGSSKSCGCKKHLYDRRGIRKLGDKPARNKAYSFYRTKALNVGLEFDLSLKKFEELTSSLCFYCGCEPQNTYKTNTDTYKYNGLDRVDNSKGYTESNVVPCCGSCNTRKSSITKEMIFKLYEWFKQYA
jgi:hypothetical protein